MTGEDPHDRAILLLEKRRQVEEYNNILAKDKDQREQDCVKLERYWRSSGGDKFAPRSKQWIILSLNGVPFEVFKEAFEVAVANNRMCGTAYVNAIIQRWKRDGEAIA